LTHENHVITRSNLQTLKMWKRHGDI